MVQGKLKEFRRQNKYSNKKEYVPVTFDELMARFILNLERDKHEDSHEESKLILERDHLRSTSCSQIELSLTNSLEGFKGLFNIDIIDPKREPRKENKGYLKCLATSTKKHNLTVLKQVLQSKLLIIKKELDSEVKTKTSTDYVG